MANNSTYALLDDIVTMYPQTEALKEANKDSSKNLVSGDFERDFTEGMVEKPPKRRRQMCITALIVLVAVLAAWLVVIVAVREVQIAKLRQEVAELSADVIAMRFTVKSLSQSIANKKTYSDVKPMDDTIYADIDQENNLEYDKGVDDDPKSQSDDSLEKLLDVTVLENVEDSDDDDYEDLDAESGDWYPDYDKKTEKIGRTNMVRITPEDFVGSVVTLKADKNDQTKPLSRIRELKRMLNEDPQNPDIFETAMKDVKDAVRSKRSVADDFTTDVVDQFAAPRTISKDDERRKTKKYKPLTGVETTTTNTAPHNPTRIARNSEYEDGKPFIAAHFHGNTSHLSPEIHEHYKGNGLVRVSHDTAHNFWHPSQWTMSSAHRLLSPALTRRSHIRIRHTGVYLVYVQIYYLDSHDLISWVLQRYNHMTDVRENLLQCAQFSPSTEPRDKANSCFSSAALLLRENDVLAVKNTGGDRHSVMKPEKSFIGLIKLANADVPDNDYF